LERHGDRVSAPAEIADGLVRLRITNAPAGAQLLLTSDSEAPFKSF